MRKLEKEVDKKELTYLEKIDSRDKSSTYHVEIHNNYVPKLDSLTSFFYRGLV